MRKESAKEGNDFYFTKVTVFFVSVFCKHVGYYHVVTLATNKFATVDLSPF